MRANKIRTEIFQHQIFSNSLNIHSIKPSNEYVCKENLSISWIIVINQVPCVSSCWGRRHTPVVCNESREPHTSHYTSRPVTKTQPTNYSNQPLCSRPVEFFSFFDIKVKKIRLYVINFFERICRSQFPEHRPHCRSEEQIAMICSPRKWKANHSCVLGTVSDRDAFEEIYYIWPNFFDLYQSSYKKISPVDCIVAGLSSLLVVFFVTGLLV